MKKKLISLLLALVMTLGLAPTTLAAYPSASAPGTLHHYKDHTYLVVEEAVSPIFAEHFCDLLGGYLATITSEGENEFLCSLMADGNSAQYYIGGTDRDKEGTWEWMNGESWEYANWYPGGFAGTREPNNGLGRGENYVCADETRDWRWVDVYGGFSTPSYSFICEWDSRISSIPTTGRTSNLPYDKQAWHESTCMVVNESVRPLFAQWYCSLVGGSLANVPASRQADFQSSVLKGGSIASYHLKTWSDKNTALPFVCQWGHVSSDWAQNEIDRAYDMDLVPDVLKDTNLTKDITRAEFAAVSVKVYEALSGTKAIPALNNPFVDTNDVEVLKAYNIGSVNGTSATTFEPN
ncbi:MAG: hypothetical protein IKK50_09855, partial [Ruminiclostridium sp.]|nr:hypothetical protein [Ruminiclostridium sp.]